MCNEVVRLRKALWAIAYTPIVEYRCAGVARKALEGTSSPQVYTDCGGLPSMCGDTCDGCRVRSEDE
jgi:hypothetical protein